MHLASLISDLAIILGIAGITTILFKKIGQPVVLGYLLAGLLVSPQISFIPSVKDHESIKIWAEIGVIVLLFCLGLEFSFKKLVKVGPVASVTAVFEIGTMLTLGYFCGRLFGWDKNDSLFLGGILSISSTTIIVRALEEFGLKQRKFVSLVLGVLIIEDLIAILLLVLLSTLSISNEFEGLQLLFSGAKLLFFITVWFLSGLAIIPRFLTKIRPQMNDESYLIVSLGLCLMMVLIANISGFSPALGAFVMGSILAETREGERIEHTLQPIKNLFAAIFFVSVGMLIDFKTLGEFWGPILIISVLTVGGKFLSTSIGALVSGQSLKHSIQTGMSLAQIGEFSFIIATLGQTLEVTSHFLYPIAVAVSVITTFITPYLIRSSEPFYCWVLQRLPPNLKSRLDHEIPIIEKGSNGLSPIGYKFFSRFYLWLESRFLGNKSEKGNYDSPERTRIPKLAPWDVHLAVIKVCPESSLVGQSLGELKLREALGVTVALIERGKNKILAPGKEDRLMPHDSIHVLGNDDQIRSFQIQVEALKEERLDYNLNFGLFTIQLKEKSPFLSKSIRSSQIREISDGLIVAIERNGNRTINPESNFVLGLEDRIWLVGDKNRISKLEEV